MEDVRAMLLEEKENLETTLKNKASKQSEYTRDIGDEIDSSMEEREKEFNLIIEDRERSKLSLIDDAIRRIDANDYGFCDQCGDDIAKKRLLIVPFTRMCIHCQKESEHGKVTQKSYFDEIPRGAESNAPEND